MLFVLIINLFFMISCTKGSKQATGEALMKADIDLSDMSGLSWQLARGSWQNNLILFANC